MTTLYVAGPMTGVEYHNFPLFFHVEDCLRALGYEVENPAKNNGENLSEAIEDAQSGTRDWADYMRLDLVRLAKADGLVLLPGWEGSKGAALEVHIAKELGMQIYVWWNGGLWQDLGGKYVFPSLEEAA